MPDDVAFVRLPDGTMQLYLNLDVDAWVMQTLAAIDILEHDRLAMAARLKAAALRAIDQEMATIRAERDRQC